MNVQKPIQGIMLFRHNQWHHLFGKPDISTTGFPLAIDQVVLVPFITSQDILITDVSIYWDSPNDATDEVIIGFYEYDNPENKIISLLGQQNTFFKFSVSIAVQDTMKEEVHLPPGVYFLALHSNAVSTIKLLKIQDAHPWSFHALTFYEIWNLGRFTISATYDATNRLMPSTLDMSTASMLSANVHNPLVYFKVKLFNG